VQHYFLAMQNITITVDEEVARWARIWAAELDTSLSELIAKLLKEEMEQEKGYRAVMRRDLARASASLNRTGGYPQREELYDRPVLRRH
jgi:hypothetical protein